MKNFLLIKRFVKYEWQYFENHSKLQRIGNVAFYNCKELKFLKIPSNVESIGNYCFSGSNIETIEIENNSKLQKIGGYAFKDCKQLKFIKIPSSVGIVGDYCFSGSNIETIEIENNSKLQRIGEDAFSDCTELKFLKIPSNVEIIGDSCFSESNVEEIHIQSHASIKFGKNCFTNLLNNFKIYYYEDCKLLGKGIPSQEHLFIIDEKAPATNPSENHQTKE